MGLACIAVVDEWVEGVEPTPPLPLAPAIHTRSSRSRAPPGRRWGDADVDHASNRWASCVREGRRKIS
jgi:hypothetical protein